ncbi:histidine--tRNA ligase [Sporosarcina pasteurii]|uniref:Histidine--tRNA ligase n=1 Tax=Sporosarcina pasteurii TaxID=1474 RepID=A0A380BTM4_SPOPA|nr:histidine--tRNA ligase [Sporosarcina pasteurii]MDS9471292.1 histidine--tRNA ligase [Sporosarcina pasteurii]QBQ05078.1 histidine--tRNA ligase [Sporosarcina pasteurii]SUJ06917.1 Histidine--tRNA ligase [Sporosarcina pasteurii]
MNFKVPRGTQDILPAETWKWQQVEQIIREVCDVYRYKEIRTPIFEQTELFQRTVGDTTDIVQKEMYTFTDRGDRSLTLRPEGTASVVRSFIENKMFGYPDQPVKLYYSGPMFRYERQQAGRYRQFVQFGVEAIGSNDPAIDAEVIGLAMDVYKRAGLSKLKLVINSLGDTACRSAHKTALIEHFTPHIDEFCSDCKTRLDKNPLRILDCKVDSNNPLIASAPSLSNYLNEESVAYFEAVKGYLEDAGIEFEVDANLVRGLDYYNHTAFEIMSTSEGFGAITTLCGGGRYNGLVEEIGGPTAPGIGFAMSIERLLLAMEAEGVSFEVAPTLDVYVVTLGERAKRAGAKVLSALRTNGLRADMDYTDRRMKAQMKSADRLEANHVIVIGDEEVDEDVVMLRNMATRQQEKISTAEVVQKILQADKEG